MPGSIVGGPCPTTCDAATVTARTNAIIAVSSCSDAGEHRFEDAESIVGPQQWIDGTLGVRHHAEHISRIVDDSGDGARGTVRAPPLVGVTRTAHVAKYHAPFAFQSIDRLLVRRVTTITVRDGNSEYLAGRIAVGKQRLRRFDTN